MNPVYVLVHHQTILEYNGPSMILGEKKRELERILREEEFFIAGSPFSIPEGLPKEREVKVCGGLKEVCVRIQINQLKKSGYVASVHEPAVVSGNP